MNIILIHIGNSKVDYLLNTVRHLVHFNNKKLFLLANKKMIKRFKDKKISKKINLIDIQKFSLSKQHQNFLNKTRLSKEAQNGLWLKSVERFFYLQNFCEKNKLKDIIHIENDVLIFDRLSKFKKVFNKYYDIGMTFLNQDLCVPGFIYFKNFKKTNFICDYIFSKNRYFFQKKNKNDMRLLKDMFQKYKNSDHKIRLLPTMTDIMAKEQRLFKKKNEAFYKYQNNFNILFDACAIGQKIGGVDKKYHKHKGSYINQFSIFDANNIKIIIKKYQNFKKPFIKINNKMIPILNVHMHSKKTNFFFN